MARAINLLKARGGSLVPPAAQRGYHIVYRDHETNYCPGCGRAHWYIGRVMAECAFCATALPLEGSAMVGGIQIVRTVRRPLIPAAGHAHAA
jgi:hypothetical protein